jgi:predicted secreted protein
MQLTIQQKRFEKRILLSFPLTILWMSLTMSLMWFVSFSLGQSEGSASTSPGQIAEERWGIKALTVRPTAEGFFIDFRYRIVDAEKAAPLFSPTIKPLLIDENTSAVMAVPTVPKVGSMRSTRKPIKDRNYAILFANPNKHIKPGHKVTVVIGDYRAEHLIVEGEESSPVLNQSTGGNGSDKGFTDPKQPIEVQKGQKFTIILDSNRTTGYRWELAHTPDTGIVEVIGSQYEASDTEKIGSGGREIWTFTARGAGTTKLNFTYIRPWERQAGPAKTTSFEIIVE